MCRRLRRIAGNDIEQADGESAYTQAKLNSEILTYVRIPKDQWPKAWHDKGYVDPVCPMVLALYGHPDSGGYWERHCEEHVVSVGFRPIGDAWRLVYWHDKLKLLLIIYVDDFKMAGPKQTLAKGWELLRKHPDKGTGIKLEEPKPASLFLGCEHIVREVKLPHGFDPRGVAACVLEASQLLQQKQAAKAKEQAKDVAEGKELPPQHANQKKAAAARRDDDPIPTVVNPSQRMGGDHEAKQQE